MLQLFYSNNKELIKFISKTMKFILLFLLFLLLYFNISNYIIRKNIDQPKLVWDYGSLSRLYSGKINAEILFFGSSRTYLGINPNIIEEISGQKTWNMGLDGSNIHQHFFTINQYLKFNRKPEIIFMEADIMLLDSNKLRFKKELFTPFIDKPLIKKGYFNRLPTVAKEYLKKIQNNSNRLFGSINNFINPNGVIDSMAYSDIYYIKGSHLKKFSQLDDGYIFDKSDFIDEYSINSNYMQVYENIVKICLEKQINLIFLAYPRFNGQINDENKLYIKKYFNTYKYDYPSIDYWDYLDLKEFNNSLLWWNVSHLNYEGANKFSTIIGKRLKESQ
tara:strand:- start:4 stop:1002 length:999 start_codon:yes stop_codon:yes gene_type:complete